MSQAKHQILNNQIIVQEIFKNVPRTTLIEWKTLSKSHKQEIEFNLRQTGRLTWDWTVDQYVEAYQERLRVAKKTPVIFRDSQQITDIKAEYFDNVDFSKGNATINRPF
jgi:hypothetical protein